MGQDWIKVDKKLPGGPKVLRLMEITGQPRDTVLGRMWLFWSWVDDHCTNRGRLRVRNVTVLTQLVGADDAFWRALMDENVQWLGEDETGLFIPEFQKWFGKSRKQRVANAERQKRYRERQREQSDSNVTQPSRVTKRDDDALEERRGEEIRGEEKRRSYSSSSLSASTSTSTSEETPAPPTHDAHKCEEGQNGKKPTTAVDWDEARDLARRIRAKLEVPLPMEISDRDLIFKVAALVNIGDLSDHQVWDSVEAVRVHYAGANPPKATRCAYWHGTLASMLEKHGRVFNALLKSIELPSPSGPVIPCT